jgi:hypothetical protein
MPHANDIPVRDREAIAIEMTDRDRSFLWSSMPFASRIRLGGLRQHQR